MDLIEENFSGRYVIRHYTTHSVTINQTEFHRSVIITNDKIITDWRPQKISELTVHDIESFVVLSPDVVLLGAGEKQQFVDFAVLQPLYKKRIGVEVMTVAAACRTFNVIAAENRPVALGLLLG
jgi:uncharacterized protein